jgi:DNA-binding GntR family transcriptional regulator
MPNSAFSITPINGPSSLKDHAYRRIKTAILNLELKPGDALIEGELAERLGISKTPVRDALTELRREGLVTKIPYSGTFVSEITPQDIRDIIQIRTVLESLAARLATPLLTEAELQKLADLITFELDAIGAGNIEFASQCNGEFHDVIIHKVQNQRLVSILENIGDQMKRIRALSSQLQGRLHKSAEEHNLVLAALRDRDPDKAEEMLRVHMLSVLMDLSREGVQRGEGVDDLSEHQESSLMRFAVMKGG